MKTDRLLSWIPLTPDGAILYLRYSFGPGTANSLAVRLNDGGWAVISPPPKAPQRVYEALEQLGGVSALIAPNAFHNLGQAAWRERFPQAVSYAHAASIERLTAKTPTVRYLGIEELLPRLPDGARILEPNGMKRPDLIFQFACGEHIIWWMGDLFSNNSPHDQGWAFQQLSRLLGGGLGYRCNARPELVYVRDRGAWIESIRRAIAERALTIAVPAHGDPLCDDAASQTRRALDAIDSH